jgi:hypothetical protein
MVVDSDNVATGRVVDALSGAPNLESGTDAEFDEWLARRRYTERLLAGYGLLGGQRVLNKTWPTNSGEEPAASRSSRSSASAATRWRRTIPHGSCWRSRKA